MTYQEFINQSCWQALRGLPNASHFDLDTLFPIAESLVPSVFQQVGEDAAGDERKRSLLRRNKTVSVSNGSATLDDDVLTAYLEDSTYFDSDDLTKMYSWVRNFSDFIDSSLADPPFSNYGYFTARNGAVLNQREAGELYDPTLGFTGSMTLNIPCVPTRPATASTALDVPDEVLNDLLDVMSAALKGEIMKQTIAQT